MISIVNAKRKCRDDISKIENYDKALADTSQTWVCHHRLELTLDGEFAHTHKELIRLGMYYKRPYFELIFLTPSEHEALHCNTEEFKQKMSESHKGIKPTKETKRKISESLKEHPVSEETKQKMSESLKGKSPVNKGIPITEFGKKYYEHYGYCKFENKKQYEKERSWYRRHEKCRWEK